MSSGSGAHRGLEMWRRAAELPRGAFTRLQGLSAYVPKHSPLLPGHRLRLLVDAAQTYPRMLEAIERARSFVHLETYIWRADQIGSTFAHLLRRKAEAGVRVRVIVDGVGSAGLPWDFLERLKDSKVEVVEFRPLGLVGSWQRLGRRDHRKILVVDGRISFCGGINIGDEYQSRDDGGEDWRDTHLEVQGPVTTQLEDLFRQTWLEHGGRHYRPYPDVGFDSVVDDEPILAVALPSDEAGQRGTIRRHYLHAIANAHESIDIANAYFVPNRQFLNALCSASSRGVSVRLLLPSLEHNDVVVAQLASQHTYRRLLDAGIRIFQWPKGHMHAKTAVIDGVWATVGSYNLDAISLFQNLEVVVEVVSEGFGARMREMFDRDFQQATELVSPSWRRRGYAQRLIEPLMYRFRRLL